MEQNLQNITRSRKGSEILIVLLIFFRLYKTRLKQALLNTRPRSRPKIYQFKLIAKQGRKKTRQFFQSRNLICQTQLWVED